MGLIYVIPFCTMLGPKKFKCMWKSHSLHVQKSRAFELDFFALLNRAHRFFGKHIVQKRATMSSTSDLWLRPVIHNQQY